jgi:hypothetical protein
MRETAGHDSCPLCVETFNWTHGYCRVLSDQVHGSHIRAEGRQLAGVLLLWRQEHPGGRLCLLGHSAGCAVALTAAELLPPDTLNRIVLLAPAVSHKHDLRPALAASCEGIDVFYSSDDWAWLGIAVAVAGTADRCRTAAAGRLGFRPTAFGPGDEGLYARLRQYPWDPSLAWTGHRGGHYGAYQPDYLRLFVLPLLCP